MQKETVVDTSSSVDPRALGQTAKTGETKYLDGAREAIGQEQTSEKSDIRQRTDAGVEAGTEPASIGEQVETPAPDRENQESGSGNPSDFISELAAAGYTGLSSDDLIALRIHGVTVESIREMNDLLKLKLPVDTLLAMRIHSVTPQFVAELKAAGYVALSADDLIAFR